MGHFQSIRGIKVRHFTATHILTGSFACLKCLPIYCDQDFILGAVALFASQSFDIFIYSFSTILLFPQY